MLENAAYYAKQSRIKSIWRYFRYESGLGISQAKLDFVCWFANHVDSGERLAAFVWIACGRNHESWS